MKLIKWLSDDALAINIAFLIKYIYVIAILWFIYGLILSSIGRQVFILDTGGGVFYEAIFAGGYHGNWWNISDHSLSVIKTSDDIRVLTNNDVETITHVGLSLMYATTAIPNIIRLCFLVRIFHNITKRQIFIKQNVFYLLMCGMLGLAMAIIAPFLKLGIAGIINFIGNNTIHILTGQDTINILVPSLVCIVAAYAIRNGMSEGYKE